MAITKKLVHFKSLNKFKEQLAAGEILGTSIVFILDANYIWTHGTYYKCDTDDLRNITNIHDARIQLLDEMSRTLKLKIDENAEVTAKALLNIEDNLVGKKDENSSIPSDFPPKPITTEGGMIMKGEAFNMIKEVPAKITNPDGTTQNVTLKKNTATGPCSHAEGYGTTSTGLNSHAEGNQTTSSGVDSHAEGLKSSAIGKASHAEGNRTVASGGAAHTEGQDTTATADLSHAEGNQTIASGNCSHAEGNKTNSIGAYSHAEGDQTIAEGLASHVEGTSAQNIYLKGAAGATEYEIVGGLFFNSCDPDIVIHKFKNSNSIGFYQTKENPNPKKIKIVDAVVRNGSIFITLESTLDAVNAIDDTGKPCTKSIYSGTTGRFSHAEGGGSVTVNGASHAEGDNCVALEEGSHAENILTVAMGHGSHAEGFHSIAEGNCSHAEGGIYGATKGANRGGHAKGDASHAEGLKTLAIDTASHAEGSGTTAKGNSSHAEGVSTTADGACSHAEGYSTVAENENSHAEGCLTTASGKDTHAEGRDTTARGTWSHAEGKGTIVRNGASAGHAEGRDTTVEGKYAHAEGYQTTASGLASHAEGGQSESLSNSTEASGDYSHAEGSSTTASGPSSHAEGSSTTASGPSSHAEGLFTTASGDSSHAEGSSTTASGPSSHAEGCSTTASGNFAHAEGSSTEAYGDCSHAEGNSDAHGDYSHAEGKATEASGYASHTEGTNTTASGQNSHAEGDQTTASGYASHAEGDNTIASGRGSHTYGGRVSSPMQSFEENISLKGIKLLTTSPLGFNINKINLNPNIPLIKHYGIVNGFDFSIDSAEARYIYDKLKFVNDTPAVGLQLVINLKMPSIHTACDPIPDNIFSTTETTEIAENGAVIQFIIQPNTVLSQLYNIEKIDNNTARIKILPQHGSSMSSISYYGIESNEPDLNTIQSIYNYFYYQDEPEFANLNGTIFKLWMPGGARLVHPACISAGDYSSANGMSTVAIGQSSHAEGSMTKASDQNSHAEGCYTIANGRNSHAEGYQTTANGQNSHAEGYYTTASGQNSHAEGLKSSANGYASHAEGDNTTANGYASMAIGLYNKTVARASDPYDTRNELFMVGNGNNSTRSNAFSVKGSGDTFIAGKIANPQADYAEMFEWQDGNTNDEDRVGYFVTLKNDKIVKATSKDNYILGIISAVPAIIGDNPDLWHGQYINDEWGRPIYEDVETKYEECVEYTEEERKLLLKEEYNKLKETVQPMPEDLTEEEKMDYINNQEKELREQSEYNVPTYHYVEKTRIDHIRKNNPEWKSDKPYINRLERKEWDAVGLMGKLLIRQDGTLTAGSFCKPNDQGIATKSDTGYYVMKVNNKNQALILFK